MRNFKLRPQEEQKWMTENTWCDFCQKADLGMIGPFEYEENGSIFVAGLCRKCGAEIRSEVTVKEGIK
jgi:hypothetical protein